MEKNKRYLEEQKVTKKVAFKILRFNPEKDHTPHYHTYTLKVQTGETIQDCLNRIKWHHDGTLTYRKACRSTVCGTCGVKINGKPWLACNAQVFDFMDKKNTVVIDPLFKENIIRDLVIDETNFWTQIKTIIPFVVRKENEKERNHTMSPQAVKKFEKSNECVMCQCCDANCSTKFNKDFLGPAALNKGYRYVVDPRDAKTEERLKLYSDKGLLDKRHSLKNERLCPLDIAPGEKVEKLRKMVKR